MALMAVLASNALISTSSADGHNDDVTIYGTLTIEEGTPPAGSGNVVIPNDDRKYYCGVANDASISYSGTNMLINPKEVGTGYVNVQGDLKVDDRVKLSNSGLEFASYLSDFTIWEIKDLIDAGNDDAGVYYDNATYEVKANIDGITIFKYNISNGDGYFLGDLECGGGLDCGGGLNVDQGINVGGTVSCDHGANFNGTVEVDVPTFSVGFRIPDYFYVYGDGRIRIVDVELSRSAADVLHANATFDAEAYKVDGTAGVDGTFTTADGKTVTVTKGIITSIVE